MILNIQILRLIAALLVMNLHFSILGNFGNYGVDIFFIISGYLIGKQLKLNISWSGFIRNRIIRIVPTYWLVTCTYYLSVFFIADLFSKTIRDNLTGIRFLKDIMFYPDRNTLLTIGWSLNYEMFFYLVCGLSLIINKKNAFNISLFFLITVILIGVSVKNNFFGSMLILEFVLGMVLNCMKFRNKISIWAKYLSYALIVLLLVFMSITEINYMKINVVAPLNYDLSRFILFGIPSALIFYLAVNCDNSLGVNNFFSLVLKNLGDASYSMYLLHTSVFKISLISLALFNIHFVWINKIISLAVTILISLIFYLVVDKKIQNKLSINRTLNQSVN